VNPAWVAFAARRLAREAPAVCSVVGFPLGANRSSIKAAETLRAIEDGASEIDMVMARGHLLSGAGGEAYVRDDIAAVVEAAQGRVVKVILETAELDERHIERACGLAAQAGASFVKTSTGFGSGGASVDAVRVMKRAVGNRLGIKASGGISSLGEALAMVDAGADRLGMSASVAILEDYGRWRPDERGAK